MKLSKEEAERHKTKTQELVIYDILNEDGDVVGIAEELAHTEHPSAVMVTYRQETRGDFCFYAVPTSEPAARAAEKAARSEGMSVARDEIAMLFDRGFGVFVLA